MAPRRKRLSKSQVMELISELRRNGLWTDKVLFDFAEKVNGTPFLEPMKNLLPFCVISF